MRRLCVVDSGPDASLSSGGSLHGIRQGRRDEMADMPDSKSGEAQVSCRFKSDRRQRKPIAAPSFCRFKSDPQQPSLPESSVPAYIPLELNRLDNRTPGPGPG